MELISAVHLFGSTDGYKTLAASRALTRGQLETLETLGFGQTDRTSYLDSLSDQPAAMGRPLPGNRYALTRCVPGHRDDAGRRTLLFISIVIPQDVWSQSVCFKIDALLRDNTLWSGLSRGSELDPRINLVRYGASSPDRETAIPLLESLVKHRGSRGLTVCESSPSNDLNVACIPQLLPLRERGLVAWGVRCLSIGAPVDLCSLEPWVSARGARQVYEPASDVCTPYVGSLAHFWTAGTHAPRAFVDQTQSLADVEPHTGVSDEDWPDPSSSARGSKFILGSFLVVLIMVGTAGAYFWFWRAPVQDAPAVAQSKKTPHKRDSVTSDLLDRYYVFRTSWDIDSLESWITDAESALPDEVEFPASPLGNATRDAKQALTWHKRTSRVLRTFREIQDSSDGTGDRLALETVILLIKGDLLNKLEDRVQAAKQFGAYRGITGPIMQAARDQLETARFSIDAHLQDIKDKIAHFESLMRDHRHDLRQAVREARMPWIRSDSGRDAFIMAQDEPSRVSTPDPGMELLDHVDHWRDTLRDLDHHGAFSDRIRDLEARAWMFSVDPEVLGELVHESHSMLSRYRKSVIQFIEPIRLLLQQSDQTNKKSDISDEKVSDDD